MDDQTPGDCFICGQTIRGSELTVLAYREHEEFSRENPRPYRHEMLFAHRECALGVAHAAFVERLQDP